MPKGYNPPLLGTIITCGDNRRDSEYSPGRRYHIGLWQSASAIVMQTDTGSGPNGILRKDVVQGIYALIAYINSGGSAHASQFLPGL